MISSIVTLDDLALDVSDRAVNEGKTVLTSMPFDVGKLVSTFGGEAAGDCLLIFVKEIDGKDLRFIEAGVALRLLVYADQGKRRIQR